MTTSVRPIIADRHPPARVRIAAAHIPKRAFGLDVDDVNELLCRILVNDARIRADEIADVRPGPSAVDELAGTIADRVRVLNEAQQEQDRRVAEYRGQLGELIAQATAGLKHLPQVPGAVDLEEAS